MYVMDTVTALHAAMASIVVANYAVVNAVKMISFRRRRLGAFAADLEDDDETTYMIT